MSIENCFLRPVRAGTGSRGCSEAGLRLPLEMYTQGNLMPGLVSRSLAFSVPQAPARIPGCPDLGVLTSYLPASQDAEHREEMQGASRLDGDRDPGFGSPVSILTISPRFCSSHASFLLQHPA